MHRFVERLCYTLVLSISVVLGVAAEDPQSSVMRMKTDLTFLAGKECQGRGVGSEGINKAADYISRQFQQAGLKPGGNDGFFQPFSIMSEPRLGTPNRFTLLGPGGQKLELAYADQFKPTADSGTASVKAPIVFAGYGISSDSPAYDDYETIDAKDKIVIVLRSTPQANKEKSPFNRQSPTWPGSRARKIQTAVKKGAKAVVFVSDRAESKLADDLLDVRDGSEEAAKIPVVHMKRAVLDVLLSTKGANLTEVESKVDETLKPLSMDLGDWRADIETSVRREMIPCKNVIGVLEGSGPLADETVVIGAHYDHLGTSSYGSMLRGAGEGQVHYGADDNASGSTGLMELARRFASIKNRVGRRLVFIAFSAEERGLFGSKEYCKSPTFPLEKTTFMINLDMIGRSSPFADKTDEGKMKDRLVVAGLGSAEGLDKLVLQKTTPAEFTLLKEQGGTGPSDHDSFYRKKIPVLFLYTGTHRDYHRPSDTVEKINFPAMLKVVDFTERIASHLLNSSRFEYKVAPGSFNDPTDDTPRRVQGPRLGIMPGNYEEADAGVLVDDISPGGAAEKAGIKAGDVVIEIAGNSVKNIGQYMRAMSTQSAGKEIEIVVLRNKKKMTLKITPK